MEGHEIIASASNSVIKRVRSVLAGKDRERMVLEGDRLIADALRVGWELELILVGEDREELAAEWDREGLTIRRVESGLLARTSELKTSPGSLALALRPNSRGVDALELSADSLVVVAAGIGDPGNLGALARSAEAAGVLALIVTAGGASPWSSKALRGSMGSLLRLQIVEGVRAEEIATALDSRGVRQVSAGTRGGKCYRDFDWAGPIALWMSSEIGELREFADSFESVSIPMAGDVDSLNVAVAGSLLMFAAERWRGEPS